MKMKQKKIIPAEELIGECNINCDDRLANYESRKGYAIGTFYCHYKSPLEIKKESEKILKNQLMKF